jgi:hypothetical protein
MQTILRSVQKKGCLVGSGAVSVAAVSENKSARPSLFSDTPGNKNNNSIEYISILAALSGHVYALDTSAGHTSAAATGASGWGLLALAVVVLTVLGAALYALHNTSATVSEGVSVARPQQIERAAPVQPAAEHEPSAVASAQPAHGSHGSSAPGARVEVLPDSAADVPPPPVVETPTAHSGAHAAAALAVAESLRKLESAPPHAPPARAKPAEVSGPSRAPPAAPRAVESAKPAEAKLAASDLPAGAKGSATAVAPGSPPAVADRKPAATPSRSAAARDPDVDLIMALMRHTDTPGPAPRAVNASTAGRTPASTDLSIPSIASLVAKCKTLVGIDAKTCQQRICSGYWGRAEACPARLAPKNASRASDRAQPKEAAKVQAARSEEGSSPSAAKPASGSAAKQPPEPPEPAIPAKALPGTQAGASSASGHAQSAGAGSASASGLSVPAPVPVPNASVIAPAGLTTPAAAAVATSKQP